MLYTVQRSQRVLDCLIVTGLPTFKKLCEEKSHVNFSSTAARSRQSLVAMKLRPIRRHFGGVKGKVGTIGGANCVSLFVENARQAKCSAVGRHGG